MTDRPLNSTAAALLGFLHEGPMSGWDLLTHAQEHIGGFWTLTQSQVYRELATMDRRGLIAKGEVGARDRTPYHITDAGRNAFAQWLNRGPGTDTIRVPLLLTLAFADHLDADQLAAIVTAARAEHQQTLALYEAIEAEVGFSPTLDFGVNYERMVVAWLDRLSEPPES